MSKMMTVNPGIPSRFPNMVDFENYSPEDMKEIIVLYSKPPSKGGEGSELTDKQKDPAPHPSQGDVTKGDGRVPKGEGYQFTQDAEEKLDEILRRHYEEFGGGKLYANGRDARNVYDHITRNWVKRFNKLRMAVKTAQKW